MSKVNNRVCRRRSRLFLLLYSDAKLMHGSYPFDPQKVPDNAVAIHQQELVLPNHLQRRLLVDGGL